MFAVKYFVVFIIFAFVATFCVLPLFRTTERVVFIPYSFENTQFTNISQNIMSDTITNCKPLFVTGSYGGMKNVLSKRGFNIKCTRHETIDIFRRKDWRNLRQGQSRFDKKCLKYNITNSNDDVFCDGGELMYMDKQWKSAVVDIEMKTSLHRILSTYCNKYHNDDNVCDFYLETYNIGIREERNTFLIKHIDCNNNKPQYDKTWVFKENIDFGSGIHLYNNHNLIYRLITSDISENINNCTFNPIQNKTYFKNEGFTYYHQTVDRSAYIVDTKDCLIQKFVSNPLLVKLKPDETVKHVFHIRYFFMIASYANPFIVLHFPKPVLMVNPNEYENKQETLDKKKIITNRRVTDPNHASLETNTDYLWGFTEFQNYLDATYGKQLFGGNYVTNKLNNDTKHILKQIFMANSYNNKLKNRTLFDSNNNYHFDMGCVDMVITAEFELKLFETNSYCGEPCDPNMIKHKKANGIYDFDCYHRYDEAAQIVMEIFNKKYYNEPIRKIDALNHYEIVFWK